MVGIQALRHKDCICRNILVDPCSLGCSFIDSPIEVTAQPSLLCLAQVSCGILCNWKSLSLCTKVLACSDPQWSSCSTVCIHEAMHSCVDTEPAWFVMSIAGVQQTDKNHTRSSRDCAHMYGTVHSQATVLVSLFMVIL